MFSKDLPAIVGLFVGFSTLKEYGVEKVFVLENGNTDSSQRNIVYVVDGEDPSTVQTVAGKKMTASRERETQGDCTDSCFHSALSSLYSQYYHCIAKLIHICSASMSYSICRSVYANIRQHRSNSSRGMEMLSMKSLSSGCQEEL